MSDKEQIDKEIMAKISLPELCEGTTTSNVMQSPGCTTWVRDQTRAVFGISFDALTATMTFSAPSEHISCFPRFCCSRLIRASNPTKTVLLNRCHSITFKPRCSYILNNKGMKHMSMFNITSFFCRAQALPGLSYITTMQHASKQWQNNHWQDSFNQNSNL